MSQKNIRTEIVERFESSGKSELDKFEFKNTIGQGNFGKVKLAVYLPTNEKVAIKILNKITIESKNEMHLVKRELNIIKNFYHINVIKVNQIIEDDINYYIIMEYCEHGELFDYIVNNKRLSEEESSVFFHQLINGVEYIHAQKIVHRDLKPENLLLNKEKILKIIDFGLSSNFDGRQYLSTKCGSPSYAAPEIIKGKEYDGCKTDIWCCGIILYAMLCGYLPFEGDDNSELFNNILKCQIEFPDFISDDAREIILEILTPDPNKRITIDQIKFSSFYLKGKELCGDEYYSQLMKSNKEDSGLKNKKKKIKGLRIVNSNSDINTFRQRFKAIKKRGDSFTSKMNEILQTDYFKNKNNFNKITSLISPKGKKNINNIITNTGIFSRNFMNNNNNFNFILGNNNVDSKVMYKKKQPKFTLHQLIEMKSKKYEIPLTSANTNSQNTTMHLHPNNSNCTNSNNVSNNETMKKQIYQPKLSLNSVEKKLAFGQKEKSNHIKGGNYNAFSTEPKEKKGHKKNKSEIRNNSLKSKTKRLSIENNNNILSAHSHSKDGKYIVQTSNTKREKSAYKANCFKTTSVLPKLIGNF